MIEYAAQHGTDWLKLKSKGEHSLADNLLLKKNEAERNKAILNMEEAIIEKKRELNFKISAINDFTQQLNKKRQDYKYEILHRVRNHTPQILMPLYRISLRSAIAIKNFRNSK